MVLLFWFETPLFFSPEIVLRVLTVSLLVIETFFLWLISQSKSFSQPGKHKIKELSCFLSELTLRQPFQSHFLLFSDLFFTFEFEERPDEYFEDQKKQYEYEQPCAKITKSHVKASVVLLIVEVDQS